MTAFHRETAGLVLLTAAAVAAALAGGEVGVAIAFALLVPGIGLLAVLGRRRSATLSAMSGLGDERDRHIYQRATSLSGTVMTYVLVGAWLVTLAQGEPDNTLALLCAVGGVVFIAALVITERRG